MALQSDPDEDREGPTTASETGDREGGQPGAPSAARSRPSRNGRPQTTRKK
jgi:hypothetical protein